MGKTYGLTLNGLATEVLPPEIKWSRTSIKITGITFGSKDAVYSNWSDKVEKVRTQVSRWSNRHLSLIGKVLVINTLLYPSFYYVAPVFPIPASVVKEVNKIVFSFLWGNNRPDLVKRETITASRNEGGLGLDNLKLKMDALLVKPTLPLLRECNNSQSHLMLTRFFTASSLRGLFPHLWSNSRPNSATCTFTLSHICSVIKKLFSLDSSFFICCSRTKHIVTLLNSEVVLSIAAVRKNPTFPWDRIWVLAANDLLDNKLQDFQWRLAHRVLYTGKRIKDWGMGDGICPFSRCVEIETIDHIFWECEKAKPIVQWVSSVVRNMIGNFTLQPSMFLFGFPELNVSKPIFKEYGSYFVCLNLFYGSQDVYMFLRVMSKVALWF